MNLERAPGLLRKFTFRTMHAATSIMPGGEIDAFGPGRDKIAAIMVINLDRQPGRWHRVKRELGRFRTGDGAPLTSIVKQFAAIDARDGRAVAATADVDPDYRIGDQLYVQPDPRLSACFDIDEPVRMTRQETAVARSHIEVWKTIARGPHKYVLVLEDDVWFRRGAAASINRGWHAALKRCRGEGPHLLYLSYADAGGSAERADVCDALFRPVRGLWFLSGYVLSREGAAALREPCRSLGRSICGSITTSTNWVPLRSRLPRSCRGRTVPRTMPIPCCPILHVQASWMPVRGLCHRIGLGLALWSPGVLVVSERASLWHCRC